MDNKTNILESIKNSMRRLSTMTTPVFVSDEMFPAGNALTYESAGYQFYLAHPLFWSLVEDHCQLSSNPANAFQLCNIPIVKLQQLDTDRMEAMVAGIRALRIAPLELAETLDAGPLFR